MPKWDYGFCDCSSNCLTCLISLFLPCYIAAENAESIDENPIVFGFGYLFCFPLLGAYLRVLVRERYNITVIIIIRFKFFREMFVVTVVLIFVVIV